MIKIRPDTQIQQIGANPGQGLVWNGSAWVPGAVTPATYVFTQGSPSASWTITHNLGYYPAVTVVDSSGNEVEGSVQYLSINQVRVTFSAAFSGSAYLS